MSMLTDVVIVGNWQAKSPLGVLLTAPLPFDNRGQYFVELGTAGAGGSRTFTNHVLAACFNHISVEDLLAWFDGASRITPYVWMVMVLDDEISGTRVIRKGKVEDGWSMAWVEDYR